MSPGVGGTGSRGLLVALAAGLLPDNRSGRARLGDLIEEAGDLRQRRGPTVARLWLAAQVAGLALTALARLLIGPEGLRADVRESRRALARHPWSTTSLVLLLALALGAGTAVFAVVDTVLLRDLPYSRPESLVRIQATRLEDASESFDLTWQEVDALTDARTLEATVGFSVVQRTLLDDEGRDPRSVVVVRSRGDLAGLLGVSPILGRAPTGEEIRAGAPVAMLSEALWASRFGRDPNVLGGTLNLESGPREVLGVLSAAHAYPHDADLWVPLSPGGDEDDDREVHVVSRVVEGASLSAAATELSAVAADLARTDPEASSDWTLRARSLQAAMIGGRKAAVFAYLGAVGAMLLVVGLNASHLMLVRSAAGDRETAIRAALGASRWRLARSRMVESVVLSLIAGLMALPFGQIVLGWLISSAPDLPLAEAVRIDARIVLATLGIAVVSGIAFGVLPALRTAAVDLRGWLAGGRTTTRRRRGVAGPGLVVSEVAVSTALVAISLALAGTLRDSLRYDRGFEVDGLVAFEVEVEGRDTGEELAAFFGDVLERTRRVPTVSAAAFTSHPLTEQRGLAVEIQVDGAAPSGTEGLTATTRIVSDGFFRTAGVPLRAGRGFEPRAGEREPELIVNEYFVRTFLSGRGQPLGANVETDWAEGTVVGVVGDVSPAIREPARPMVYLPLDQVPLGGSLLLVRTESAASAVGADVWAAINAVEPAVVPRETAVLANTIRASVATERFNLSVVGAFAVVALLLAGVGVFGVASETVSVRLREVGIRRALGGSAGRVTVDVLGGIARVVAAGVVLGILMSAVSGRALATLFVDTTPASPLLQVSVGLILATVAALASALPLLRVVRVSAVDVLADE